MDASRHHLAHSVEDAGKIFGENVAEGHGKEYARGDIASAIHIRDGVPAHAAPEPMRGLYVRGQNNEGVGTKLLCGVASREDLGDPLMMGR